jgi:hypothetical protein
MVKLIVYALVLFGLFAVISAWMPTAWTQGFAVKGHTVPWAVPIVFGGLYLVYTLKGK